MNRRLLVIEPDTAGRAMMGRALTMVGFVVEAAASIHDARPQLSAGDLHVAVVDELAGGRGLLDEVRWLRGRHPTLPVIVTGTLLTFALMAGSPRAGAVAAACERLGGGKLLGGGETRERVDLDRAEALR